MVLGGERGLFSHEAARKLRNKRATAEGLSVAWPMAYSLGSRGLGHFFSEWEGSHGIE